MARDLCIQNEVENGRVDMHLVAELLVDGDVYPVAVPGEAFEQPLEMAVVLVVRPRGLFPRMD